MDLYRHIVRAISLGCAAACLPWMTARAQAPAADAAMELKDREINLLKTRARIAEGALRENSLARQIAETQVRVAALREFKIARLVTHEPLTQEVIDRLIDHSLEGMFPGRKLDLFVWGRQVFGALPEGIDLRAFYSSLIGEQAGGLYDPATKALYVSPNFKLEGMLGSIILSHEICHALQDQNFNLVKMGLEDAANADRSLVTLSLAEGDATLLMTEYMTVHGDVSTLVRDIPSLLRIDQKQLNNAPAAVREELLFPYIAGADFFERLGGRTRQAPGQRVSAGERKGWRSEVFLDPPDSTEQIMHPEKYLARELPTEIAELTHEADATAIQTPMGEFGVAALLLGGVERERAFAAAAGWDGDRMLMTEDAAHQKRRLAWNTHWDSAADADEFALALADALQARYGSELEWKRRKQSQDGQAQGGTLRIRRPDERSVELEIQMPVRASQPAED